MFCPPKLLFRVYTLSIWATFYSIYFVNISCFLYYIFFGSMLPFVADIFPSKLLILVNILWYQENLPLLMNFCKMNLPQETSSRWILSWKIVIGKWSHPISPKSVDTFPFQYITTMGIKNSFEHPVYQQ